MEINQLTNVSELAKIVQKDWAKINPHAQHYLDAMLQINSIDDDYYFDSAKTVVNYFLANAQGWRGETARNVKARLNQLVKGI